MKRLCFILLTIYFLLPLSIGAQTVDILYRANTYTPPFYSGVPVWSSQSEITFSAVMTGVSDPKSLYYLWSRDGTVLGLVSGKGKDTLTFSDTLFSKSKTIYVEVSNANEEIVAESSTTLTPRTPEILIYEKSPLYGYMFHNEVGREYKMRGEEVTFSAFPFFFSTPVRFYPTLKYSWGESDITYRVPEGESGRAAVSLKAESKDFLKQTADRSFFVRFGKENE